MPLTVKQMLVIAASELPEKFSEAELTVKAWLTNKKEFGLAEHEELYPDNNIIRASLSGESGLRSGGHLERISPKMYRLTESGRVLAEALKRGEIKGRVRSKNPSKSTLLPVKIGNPVVDLLSSIAYRTFRSGLKAQIDYLAALAFWDLPMRASQKQANTHVNAISELLVKAQSLVNQNSSRMPNGRIITDIEISTLICLHNYLKATFGARLELQ